MSVAPPAEEFHLQLAHEICHLLDPWLYDWYAEGLGNVFAEHWVRKRSLSWEPWSTLFAKGAKSNPYAIAYFMMREVEAIAGPEAMRNLRSCAVPQEKEPGKRRLDIDSWLNGIEAPAREQVREIILHHAAALLQNKGRQNAFSPPGVE